MPLLAVALVLTGFNLRIAVASVPPLLSELERAPGMSTTVAGLLTSLPVLQDDAVIGVLTQRGVMRAVADCEHPCESRVFDYMDTGPVTVSPDDDVAVAVLRMLAIGCLDIPVVQQQALVGTVSGRGLIAAQVQLLGVSV